MVRAKNTKKRALTEFRGVFLAPRPHPGKDAIRREVGRMLAKELEQKTRRR